MSGYYPDGVTGNEYEIAGADREWEDDRDVVCTNDDCDSEGETQTVTVDLQSYRSSEWGTWTCPKCGTENDYEGDADSSTEEIDPDYLYDLYRESQWED